MSGIEELQQRVVEAEERFGLINAERAKYSERLMGLIDAIETRLGDQQAEIERQAGETASQAAEMETLRRDSVENKLLRGMLQSLLNAIELGNSVALTETMQALDTKISALIGAGANMAEAAPGEGEAPQPEPQEIEAAAAEISEPEPDEAEVPEIEAADPIEEEIEESAEPEPVAAEVAGPEPEAETAETELEEPEAPELEAVEVAEAVDPEPEAIPEADTDVADELAAAEETQAAPDTAFEPEAETETGVPEVLDIPASDADVTMLGEETMIGAAGGDTPSMMDAVEENLVDDTEVVLDIPAADAGEQRPEASSLEDIMRRVSKLVEDEGAMGPLAAGGVQIDANAPAPETQDPEPAEAQSSASGG
jgi:hypothetical protein